MSLWRTSAPKYSRPSTGYSEEEVDDYLDELTKALGR
ncbi:MAG: DivIVA domain-containing protein [Ornithinimicrobium sp.]